jgi:hypothetical protein
VKNENTAEHGRSPRHCLGATVWEVCKLQPSRKILGAYLIENQNVDIFMCLWLILQKMNPEEEEALIQFVSPPTNLNHLNNLKFKKSLTA